VEHRVEEVLHLGASDTEIAETLDIGLYMAGSLAMKSVRYAFQIMEEVRARRG
jgi:alkylhydroperoxidase/carboxymuconolactone decarboxylase family protein YurZ